MQPRPTRTIRIPLAADVYVRTGAACPLGPIEAQVLSRIDGSASLSEVAEMLNLSVRETAMVIARLVELGAAEKRVDDIEAGWDDVRPDGETVPPPAPSAPRAPRKDPRREED